MTRVNCELPEKLMERVKIRAIRQNKRFKTVIEELLVEGLRRETANIDDSSRIPTPA